MTRAIVTAITVFVLGHSLLAQDWPQWRGPSRDGTIATAPAAWPASFSRAWRVEVGEGYSSPVVADDRVLVHSRRDPKEIVTAIDLATGQVVWRQEYDAPYAKNQYAARMGRGPNATPLVAGGRVFTIGATGVLTAWDARAGTHLWQKNFTAIVDFSKLFCGTAASPLLIDGAVVVQVGSDVHGGSIVALDPATGTARWEWRGAGPGYASPIVAEVEGVTQIITLTNRSALGVDARTGRELWSTPLPNEWHENIVTPVWTGRHVIVSSNQTGTTALTLARSGERWTATPAWNNAELTLYMSTPVIVNDVLYGFSNKRRGSFVAVDAATGALRWQSEGRDGTNAVALKTATHVLFLNDQATLTLIRRNSERFDLERKYELGIEETWATPVVLGSDLIVKDATSVTRLKGA